MSRRYYNKRGNDLSTDEIVDILVNIDNGEYDDKVDEKNWYNKLDNFRDEMIEILLRRYRGHYVFSNRKDKALERAYNIYLKHYVK